MQPGALITTAKDSVCQVVFNSRNIVHMAAGTTLRFDLNAVSKGATLQKGAIAMVLRNLNPFISAKPGDELRFSIRTSTAVAGVRGTCFFVDVEDENNTYICACNGAIHLEGEGGQFTQNIASSHHREVRVTRSATGILGERGPAGVPHRRRCRIGCCTDWRDHRLDEDRPLIRIGCRRGGPCAQRLAVRPTSLAR